MKAKEIFELFKKGVRPVLECTKEVFTIDCDPDEGMRGKLLDIEIADKGESYECLKFVLDFGMFEPHNIEHAKHNYYDSNGVPCETWFQQDYYERDKNRVEFYIGYDSEVFKLVENSEAYEDYIASKSDLNYVSWLEEQYHKLVLIISSQNMHCKLN